MEARKRLDRLHLYDDELLDEQIEPVAGIEPKALIVERLWNLAADRQAAEAELVGKASFVHGLQESGTQCPMDLQSRIDDLPRHGVDGR